MVNFYRKHKTLITVAIVVFALAIPLAVFAAPEDSTPTLTLSLNLSDIFTYAQLIVNALMPIVLITAGFGLGFFVLKVIANAFKSLG